MNIAIGYAATVALAYPLCLWLTRKHLPTTRTPYGTALIAALTWPGLAVAVLRDFYNDLRRYIRLRKVCVSKRDSEQ